MADEDANLAADVATEFGAQSEEAQQVQRQQEPQLLPFIEAYAQPILAVLSPRAYLWPKITVNGEIVL